MRRDTCSLRDVLEPHVACVEVEATRDHVAGQEDVRQAVVVDVGDRDAGAIVDVGIRQHVHGIADGDGIGERDSGLARREQLEERGTALFTGTATSQQQNRQRAEESCSHSGRRVLYSAT